MFGIALLGGPATAVTSEPTPVAEERARLLQELQQVYRTLYALSADAERGQILEELLSHEVPSMRAFGLDLARRTLLNAREVPIELLERAESSISDTSAVVRANAAKLIATRGGERASVMLAEALGREADERVAVELLRALSQQPGGLAVEALLPWAERGWEVGDAAMGVAAVILRSRPDSVIEPVRDQLREIVGPYDAGSASVPRVVLASELGMWDYVESALRSEDLSIRTAAAREAAREASRVDLLVEIARRDARLSGAATEAIALHRPTAEGYAVASSLPSVSEDQRREGLRRVLLALGPAELVTLAGRESDLFEREALLRHVADESFATRRQSDASWDTALGELIVTRSKLNDCAGALGAADLLAEKDPEGLDGALALALVRCGVLMGQIERAEALSAALLTRAGSRTDELVACWVDGIASLPESQESTRRAASTALRVLAGSLDADQREWLFALTSEAPAEPTPVPPTSEQKAGG